MSRRISITEKSARALLTCVGHVVGPEVGRAVDEVRRALAPRPEKPQRKATRAAKQSKREAKNAETARIRAEVIARSGGICECGCGQTFSMLQPAELDHMFGRGKVKQTARNCWALTRTCHGQKTVNMGGAEYWLGLFIRHANRHGFTAEADFAQRRIDALVLVARAEQAGKAVRHG